MGASTGRGSALSTLHRKVGVHPLELGVLAFEFLDPSELGDFQATIFALPVVEGRLTDPVGAAYIGRLHSGIGFLEDCHDLALRESALFHWSPGSFPSPIL